jgi:hypothetical protein
MRRCRLAWRGARRRVVAALGSQAWSRAVVALTLLAMAITAAEIVLDSVVCSRPGGEATPAQARAAVALSAASLAIVCAFALEIIVVAAALGPRAFVRSAHAVDALAIAAALVLAVVLRQESLRDLSGACAAVEPQLLILPHS